MCSLPPELLDKVIDESWDDVSALKACSLTSRVLLPRTRTYLFETIFLNTATKFHVLCTDFPYLAQYVKRITISTRRRNPGKPIRGDRSFPALLRLIPPGQLEHLKFEACNLNDMRESSKQALSSHSFRSASVYTNCGISQDIADLCTVFKGSRNLHLDFNGVLKDLPTSSTLPVPKGGSLAKLTVEGYYWPLFQTIIQTGIYPFSVDDLKSLSVTMHHPNEVNELKQFLDLPLRSLQHLSIAYDCIALNISRNLCSLSMSIGVLGHSPITDSLGWCLKNLKRARQMFVETFTINITFWERRPTEIHPNVSQFWSKFAGVLSDSEFGSIRNISLIFSPVPLEGVEVRGLELYQGVVEREMAPLISRGLVTVCHETQTHS
ncbi:uncharacterized protein BT62DRAFT_1055160 [Guyanagaster necrorhizus]|uniref:Uncharacterized protein n=1 Tax=Guyanagaster necrorhizus TaxID=856835 RepID=A0A9P7VFP2_9AGAR|nr:uncharacterized protein BT62DRAFT_1055160 [Guyanagaster necrorhizus MCA 3950]KAG7439718.1 hypothetical protein BT62DRAFT_1055160 [Guyanagaster necrorhizus MCA 3950]